MQAAGAQQEPRTTQLNREYVENVNHCIPYIINLPCLIKALCQIATKDRSDKDRFRTIPIAFGPMVELDALSDQYVF